MNARYEMTAEVARAKARRGHAVRRAEVFRIEGEPVTMDDIAKRLGVAKSTAQKRMARERAKPGAVTWEGLA